jgi:hypothetical protein
MKPANIANKLRLIAANIDKSQQPSISVIARDVGRILALLLNQPKKIKPSPGHKFFGFFTNTYNPRDNWTDVEYVQEMLDRVYDAYHDAEWAGNPKYFGVVGFDTDEDFSLVIEVPDDFDFDAVMDDGWEIEDTSKVVPLDPNKDIGQVWWDNYAQYAYDPNDAKAEDIYKALDFQGN